MGKHSAPKGTAAGKRSKQQQGSQVQDTTGEYSEDQSGSSYTDQTPSGDTSASRQDPFSGGSQR